MLGDKDLELVKLGIDGLEALYRKREFKTDELVDLAARIHSLKSRLTNIDTDGTERIKGDLIKTKKSIVEGDRWMGQLTLANVFRLDTNKVKLFLGKKLKQFGNTNTEYRLRYIPRG